MSNFVLVAVVFGFFYVAAKARESDKWYAQALVLAFFIFYFLWALLDGE